MATSSLHQRRTWGGGREVRQHGGGGERGREVRQRAARSCLYHQSDGRRRSHDSRVIDRQCCRQQSGQDANLSCHRHCVGGGGEGEGKGVSVRSGTDHCVGRGEGRV